MDARAGAVDRATNWFNQFVEWSNHSSLASLRRVRERACPAISLEAARQ